MDSYGNAMVWMSSNHKILPGNVCRKVWKFPESPGNPNWWTCNIILMTINEAYLVALSATATSNYIPMMTPGHVSWGLLRPFLGILDRFLNHFWWFTNLDFLEFQEISTISCTRFLAILFWFEDIQTLPSTRKFEETLPCWHRYNSLGARALRVHRC